METELVMKAGGCYVALRCAALRLSEVGAQGSSRRRVRSLLPAGRGAFNSLPAWGPLSLPGCRLRVECARPASTFKDKRHTPSLPCDS